MTIREKVAGMLFERGLFESEAQAVIEKYVASEIGKEMSGRMDDGVEDYPESVITVTWMGIKRMALEWIDENCPMHWARPLFE